MNHRNTRARRVIIGGLALVLGIVLAACSSSKSSDVQAGRSAESSAKGAIASATANPTTAADLAKAKALVKTCFAGTPLQQAHQVHLVFLSSATGKNGPAVVAARTKTLGCMGISKSDEKPFTNDAITAAEHANPKLTTHAGRVQYLEVTLPGLVVKYSNASGATGTPTAPAPAASTKSGASA